MSLMDVDREVSGEVEEKCMDEKEIENINITNEEIEHYVDDMEYVWCLLCHYSFFCFNHWLLLHYCLLCLISTVLFYEQLIYLIFFQFLLFSIMFNIILSPYSITIPKFIPPSSIFIVTTEFVMNLTWRCYNTLFEIMRFLVFNKKGFQFSAAEPLLPRVP